ncbi:MAG: hypothetical protein AAF389_04195 [Gemmatimonadota bacterium]
MSLHDAYARVTPVELLFPEEERAERLGERIAEEAAGRGADPTDLAAFLTMGAAAEFIGELAASEDELSARYGPAAYHAHHFLAQGNSLYLLHAAALRYLIGGAPTAPAEGFAPPTRAAYVQLPRHLVWVRGEDDAPASVDGVFWTVGARGGLHVLVATGVRGDGSGFDVLPLPEAPLADLPAWLAVDGRGDGSDYTTSLPGAELDQLYEIRTAGEVLKLLARVFAYLHDGGGSAPSTLMPAGVEGETLPDATAPKPSRYPYIAITLTP